MENLQKTSQYTSNVCTKKQNSCNISLRGGENMEKSMYVGASEVAEIIGMSRSKAYKMIQEMNEELKARDFIVINGRVPRKFLMDKIYK